MAVSTSSEEENYAENLSTQTEDELWASLFFKFRAECGTSDRLRWRVQYLRNAIDACSLMDMKKRQAEQRRSCKRKHGEVSVENDGTRLS